MDASLLVTNHHSGKQSLSATKGLFADLRGKPVFIVSTYSAWRVGRADVLRLSQRSFGGYYARFADIERCRQDELTNVGTRFVLQTQGRRPSSALFFVPSENDIASLSQISLLRLAATAWVPRPCDDVSPSPVAAVGQMLQVEPFTAQAHVRTCAGRGERHCVAPRQESKTSTFVLDLPLPVALDDRTWRCQTCRDSHPAQYLSFAVTDSDVRAALPGVLIWRPVRARPVYMTPRFLVHLVLVFYETLNLRAVKRRLVEYYSGNCLAFAGRASFNFAWAFAAVPRCQVLRSVLLTALAKVLQAQVRDVTAQVFVYSGQGVRSDGNFKLPKRIGRLSLDKKYVVRDFNVVLGFCGVDGVLLKPVRSFAGETLKDIESELGPMLDRLRESRLQQGFSLDQSAPVFHATDRYHPDRHGYARIPAASIPKGVPTHAFNTDYSDGSFLIVGDPEHDLIALRKIVSPKLVDSHNFLFDHGDMLHRLSAERPSTEKAGARHMRTAKLHASAVVLLRSGVENTKAEFLKKKQALIHQLEVCFALSWVTQAYVNRLCGVRCLGLLLRAE